MSNSMNKIESRLGVKLKPLMKGQVHQEGVSYYSGYWCKTYKVIKYSKTTDNWMPWSVLCEWEDGDITEHCTPLDYKHDYQIID